MKRNAKVKMQFISENSFNVCNDSLELTKSSHSLSSCSGAVSAFASSTSVSCNRLLPDYFEEIEKDNKSNNEEELKLKKEEEEKKDPFNEVWKECLMRFTPEDIFSKIEEEKENLKIEENTENEQSSNTGDMHCSESINSCGKEKAIDKCTNSLCDNLCVEDKNSGNASEVNDNANRKSFEKQKKPACLNTAIFDTKQLEEKDINIIDEKNKAIIFSCLSQEEGTKKQKEDEKCKTLNKQHIVFTDIDLDILGGFEKEKSDCNTNFTSKKKTKNKLKNVKDTKNSFPFSSYLLLFDEIDVDGTDGNKSKKKEDQVIRKEDLKASLDKYQEEKDEEEKEEEEKEEEEKEEDKKEEDKKEEEKKEEEKKEEEKGKKGKKGKGGKKKEGRQILSSRNLLIYNNISDYDSSNTDDFLSVIESTLHEPSDEEEKNTQKKEKKRNNVFDENKSLECINIKKIIANHNDTSELLCSSPSEKNKNRNNNSKKSKMINDSSHCFLSSLSLNSFQINKKKENLLNVKLNRNFSVTEENEKERMQKEESEATFSTDEETIETADQCCSSDGYELQEEEEAEIEEEIEETEEQRKFQKQETKKLDVFESKLGKNTAKRKAAKVDINQLEDPKKKCVFVLHKGMRIPVSWFADTPLEDMKEAILCACDAILDDGGFVMREVFMCRNSVNSCEKCDLKCSNVTKTLNDRKESLEEHTKCYYSEKNNNENNTNESKCDSCESHSQKRDTSLEKNEIRIAINGKEFYFKKGRKYEYEEFDELRDSCTYILEPSSDRDDLKNIIGDKWRRLTICIDPLLHVETQVALQKMKGGTNLLKHTRFGFPHLRQFQLSSDFKRLVWYSGAKYKDSSIVYINEMHEIHLGQVTNTFKAYRIPVLQNLSFSLVYGLSNKTLDLTCKDEFEFDYWITGLKALLYAQKKKCISKQQLLSHSRRFRKALEENSVSIKFTELPEITEKGQVCLDDCIDLPFHLPHEIFMKLDKLKERLEICIQHMKNINVHVPTESSIDVSLLAGAGPAYAAVFCDSTKTEDEEMEIARMHSLSKTVKELLEKTKYDILNLCTEKHRSQIASKKDEIVVSISSDGKIKTKNSSTPSNISSLSSSSLSIIQNFNNFVKLFNLSDDIEDDDTTPMNYCYQKYAWNKDELTDIERTKLKNINQLLWKAEVDLENIEDLYSRHVDNSHKVTTAFSKTMAEVNAVLSDEFQKLSDSFNLTLMNIFGNDSKDPCQPLNVSSVPYQNNCQRYY